MPPSDPSTCTLCGEPIDDGRSTMDGRDPFCSTGCRDVHRVFPGSDPVRGRIPSGRPAPIDYRSTVPERPGVRRSGDPDPVRSYFRVDGMHSATCEAFLESVVRSSEGVSSVEASYVTESVCVDHHPDRVSGTELRDAMSTLGYTAYLRDRALRGDRDADAGDAYRTREMSGTRKRRTEELLGFRYVVGVVFGAFILLPYVALLYPTYLSSFYSGGFLALYEGAFEGGTGGGFFRVFFVLTGIVLVFTGMPTLRRAYVGIRMRRPNTDALAALAVLGAFIYGTIAVFLGRNDVYYDLTIAIAAIATAATFHEATVKRRAMDRLVDLTFSQVGTARRLDQAGTVTEVDAADLVEGDRVLVPHGDRIPVDGILAEGTCTVDEAVVTGESLPVAKRSGDRVVGGAVVTSDAAVIRVDALAGSRIERLTRAVWDIQSADHGVQRRANAVAGAIVPIVLGLAVFVGAVLLVRSGRLSTAALGFFATLFVASPWALSLSTPLSVAASIQDALDRGIVVFDETIFERLRDVEVVVLDKTGTLTTGSMSVVDVHGPPDLLETAATLERRSSHPAARAIESAYATMAGSADGNPKRTDGGNSDDPPSDRGDRISDFRTHPTGVEGRVDGTRVLVGHRDLFEKRGWIVPAGIAARAAEASDAGRLPVVVGRDGRAEGVIVVGDEPRDGWEGTVTGLHRRGIEVVVLTGDTGSTADRFRAHPAIDHVFAGVPPAGKTAAIRRIGAESRVAMVGDGTNDAPAIAAADLGISLGSGTALATDAADLAIVDDDLRSVETAFELAGAAGRRITQNTGLAFVYNAVAIPVAIVGSLNPFVTAVALLLTGLLIASNAFRPLVDDRAVNGP